MYILIGMLDRFRIMSIGGQDYAWVPRDNTICVRNVSILLIQVLTPEFLPQMYKVNSSNAACLAKLSKEHGSIKLDVSPTAIQNGLLQPSVLAVVLLQSGQRID